jgi:hypothetical protein
VSAVVTKRVRKFRGLNRVAYEYAMMHLDKYGYDVKVADLHTAYKRGALDERKRGHKSGILALKKA